MEGEKAQITITDPPYNVGIFISDTDDNYSFEEYQAWTKQWATLAPKSRILTVGIQRLVWWDSLLGDPQWIIAWVKRNGQGNTKLLGTNKWDAILVYDVVPDRGTDVIELNNDYSENIKEQGLHPTAKPIELYEILTERFTRVTDLVYEPFLGAGTTLIACERLGRKCRAVEISPAYCAVAIQRWADMTGGEPELVTE
jgi:DNA modification methylase